MNRELTTRNQSRTMSGSFSATPRILQRKCACGGSCEDCKKKKLQRRAASANGPAVAPPIVHDVLRSSGQPLDKATRSFFEPRFGHSFGNVRVHTDEKAAESARAINALAYTSGNNVIFDHGQFAPQTLAGQKLLAHELTHVVQQQSNSAMQMPELIGEIHDASESEAERIAEAATRKESVAAGAQKIATGQDRKALRRLLRVDRPSQPIPAAPNAAPNTPRQTNSEAVEGYLNNLASGSNARVDRSSGVVHVDTAYCPGFLGGMVRGASVGYGIGSAIGLHIPVVSQLFGLVGGLIGGIVGGIGGLFGADISRAAASNTPTGSTCICDMMNTSSPWVIEINDTDHPRTMHNNAPDNIRSLPGGRDRVPSPNSSAIWGAANMAGQLENDPPWLILGHELCGHAWLQEKHRPEESESRQAMAFRDPQTGQLGVSNRDMLSGNTIAPHGDEFPIQRENLIRREHGMSERGFRIRDPYCGESFSRTSPQGAPQFTQGEDPLFTNMQQCEFLRSQLPENRGGRYRIEQQIPEPQSGSH